MPQKISIISSLLGLALVIAYAATWDIRLLCWALVAALVAMLAEIQWEDEEAMRAARARDRERVRLMRQQEDFAIWCGLQEEKAHRRIMEEVQKI